MAPGAALPVDFTTAYIPAAITYSSRDCQPSPTPECTVWRGTSFSAPSDYVTMAEYMEVLRSTYIVDDDDTSFTFDLINATNMLSDINEWRSAILTAVPQSVANMDPAVIASSEGLVSEAWVQSMPIEVRRYYLTAYLPQFTTKMVYHEFVAPTRSIALPSEPSELRGIVSYEFDLAALQIAGMEVTATIASSATGIMASSRTKQMTSTGSTATISGSSEGQAADATSTRARLSPLVAVAISIPVIITIAALCCIVYCCSRRRQRRRQQEPAFERASRKSSHQIDYNSKPVYPHKPLQLLSDMNFDSTSESDLSYLIAVPNSPPKLPPLPEMGESGLIRAVEEEKSA